MGIGPTSSAWKADALPLSYTRDKRSLCAFRNNYKGNKEKRTKNKNNKGRNPPGGGFVFGLINRSCSLHTEFVRRTIFFKDFHIVLFDEFQN